MCVTLKTKVRKTKEQLLVYKVVRLCADGKFKSAHNPGNRSKQRRATSKGGLIIYDIEKLVTSSLDETPGLYCFEGRDDATFYGKGCMWEDWCVLVCSVPVGTRYRLAYSRRVDIKAILVEALVPLCVYDHPYLGRYGALSA